MVRYGGANRFATAVVIAEEGLDTAETETVLLADGGDFPDAVSAGAAAAEVDGRGHPHRSRAPLPAGDRQTSSSGSEA